MIVAVTLAGLALVVLGIPHEYALLAQPCLACEGPQLSPVGAARLAELGLVPQWYAAYQLAFELLYIVISTTVGALLFWRHREDPVALLVALTLVSFGMAFPNLLTSTGQAYPVLQPLILSINYVAIVTFVAFFYVFPDGRCVPRWTAGLLVGWALVSLGAIVLLARDLFRPQDAATSWRNLYFALYYALLAGGVAAQIWRYRRTGDLVQRQQTKWVVSAICVAIVGFLVFNVIGSFMPRELSENPVTALLLGPLFYLAMQLIPIAIGVSVLRYRLWDIDPLLSRTLVYGILTACGVLVYVLVVAGLGTLFQARGNPLIALTATGVVAVFFQPLRERLQHTINRVVFGERDDPYRALSTLGRRLESTTTPDM
ncbi:MAG TPA: hypothetical protein VFT99_14480, partial [Roseiflexaceae bacterium]|nr:hypothetical protein [Roseiflexaceae bacterium]